MKQVKLPLTIDITRAAQKRLDYHGGYAHKQLTRIAESVVSIDSEIDIEVKCYLDEQGLAVAEGRVTLSVSLLCQRCGLAFGYPVQLQFCVTPASNMEQSTGHYDPVEVDAFGKSDLLGLIEDEIILSLPIVPRHQSQQCKLPDTDQVFGQLPEETVTENPFGILANLKDK